MPRDSLLSLVRGRLLAFLALALLAVMSVVAPFAAAEDGPLGGSSDPEGLPVGLVLLTAGLTWEDVSSETTPHLSCLAEHAGVGAMNTTSATARSTQAQGVESVRSGHRGLASQAPASAGIPHPPLDQLDLLPVPVIEVDARSAPPITLDGTALSLVDLGALPPAGSPDREVALADLDARLGTVLESAGGCAAFGGPGSDAPRTLLLSVAALPDDDGSSTGSAPSDSETPGSGASGIATASRSTGLQVAFDTGWAGRLLTSGSTHQSGVVVLTDVLPTILDSYDVAPAQPIPGQPFRGEATTSDPVQTATDRTLAARLVDRGTVPALGSWLALGVIGIGLRRAAGRRPTRRGTAASESETPVREASERSIAEPQAVHRVPARAPSAGRLLTLSRLLMTIAPLALPVGLMAGLVPWWRAGSPTLALTGWVWAGSAALAVIVLAIWRGTRSIPAALGASLALVAALILLESALGSPWQLGSPLGAQAISGGRYYGLSNHLFGIVLAASLLALLCLFTRVHTPRWRAVWTAVAGAVVAGVCVAPSMGADFGSMLVTVPAFGLLVLLVAGIRLRLWHVLALGIGGAIAVMGVSFADWMRPPEQRTHLGRFIDDIASGELASVILRKLSQNVHMLLGIPLLGLVVLIALLASIAILMPRRLRWRSLAALDARLPVAYPARVALVAGGWLGYVVNDTGPVLIAAMLGLSVLGIGVLLPARDEIAPAESRAAGGLAGGSADGDAASDAAGRNASSDAAGTAARPSTRA